MVAKKQIRLLRIDVFVSGDVNPRTGGSNINSHAKLRIRKNEILYAEYPTEQIPRNDHRHSDHDKQQPCQKDRPVKAKTGFEAAR